MNTDEHNNIKMGEWYYIEYGYDIVAAQCAFIHPRGGAVMRFRWGTIMRGMHHVDADRIIGSAPDPRWLARVLSILSRMIRQ
jgi:hypothetical protein